MFPKSYLRQSILFDIPCRILKHGKRHGLCLFISRFHSAPEAHFVIIFLYLLLPPHVVSNPPKIVLHNVKFNSGNVQSIYIYIY